MFWIEKSTHMEAKRFEVVPISKIKVGPRFRKDMGDIDGLAQSIKEHDLLQPILLNSSYELIAGGRRLEAFKKLGRTEIPAYIVDVKNIVGGKIEESAVRKAFSVSEMVDIYRHRATEEKEAAQERMMAGKPLSESDKGRATDRIARIFGISRDTLYKAQKIVEGAEKNPEKFGDLLRMVDEGKISVNRAYKQLLEPTRVQELPPTGSIGVPSADLEKQSPEIDFEFQLPYESIEDYVHGVEELITEPNDRKRLAISVNGRIDTQSGKVVFAGLGSTADRDFDNDREVGMPRTEPLFGFAIGGLLQEVTIAPGHIIVSGLTQESGKTTALEGLLARWAKKKIVVFICKRGEVFQQYPRIEPFISDDGSTPASVPEIPFSDELKLKDGIQVMDLQNLDPEIQAKVIGSASDEVQKKWKDVVLVIPEAWQILPREKDTTAKTPVERLMRQGAAKGNFVVLDSQDISGIDVPIRKNIGSWIIGRQSEINEIARAIEHLTIKKDWEEMKRNIQTLKLGQFYVVTRGEVTKAFAWPVWMKFYDALDCADDPNKVYEISKKYKENAAPK